MKTKYLLLVIFLLGCYHLKAQQIKTRKSFSIEGKIDTSIKELFFRYDTSYYGSNLYRIPVINGKFHFETDALTEPKIASFFGDGFYRGVLLVAPGYHLYVNGESYPKRKITITGDGANIAKYYIELENALANKKEFLLNNDLNQQDFLKVLDKRKQLQDSIYQVTFKRNMLLSKTDSWFAKGVLLENLFFRANDLTEYVLNNIFKLSHQEAKLFFEKNVDTAFSEDKFLKPEYLLNYYPFQRLINDGKGYLGFMTQLKSMAGFGQGDPEYPYKAIFEIYKDPILQDFALSKQLIIRMNMISSAEIFEQEEQKISDLILRLNDKNEAKQLLVELAALKSSFSRIKLSMAAPAFNLKDPYGKMVSSQSFVGKVVYLDLWASWCAPCREETPAFKLLYEKYKSNPEIVFVSIAVNDKELNWRKALKEDQPTWMQLLDNGSVLKDYAANAIPKFIIIDKKGNIVNVDAPRPSAGQELEKALLQALNK